MSKKECSRRTARSFKFSHTMVGATKFLLKHAYISVYFQYCFHQLVFFLFFFRLDSGYVWTKNNKNSWKIYFIFIILYLLLFINIFFYIIQNRSHLIEFPTISIFLHIYILRYLLRKKRQNNIFYRYIII